MLLTRSFFQQVLRETIDSSFDVSTLDWTELQRLAIYHDLEAFVWSQLRSLAVPEPFARAWQQVYYTTALRNLAFQEQLQPVLQAAEAASIKVGLLKGMALLSTVYANPALRPMVDVDLLVQRADVAHFWAILSSHKFMLQPMRPRDLTLLHRHIGELKLEHQRTQFLIELHWWLYAGAWSQAAGLLNVSIHWRRMRHVALGAASAWVLHPHDQILHLAQHALVSNQLGQGVGRMLRDLHVVVLAAADSLCWPQLWHEARRLGLQTVLWLALALMQYFYGTPLPFALDQYAPSLGRRVALRALTRPESVLGGEDLRFRPLARFTLLLLLLDHPTQRLRLLREGLRPVYHGS